MPRLIDAIYVDATTTNVVSGRISANAPKWARKIKVSWSYSDSDASLSASIGGSEYARSARPFSSYAVNLHRMPGDQVNFIEAPVTISDEILIGVTETTAGEGMVWVVFE